MRTKYLPFMLAFCVCQLFEEILITKTSKKMLFKILLLLIYFVIIFVGSRIVEFSASVVGVTSLTLICELIPRSFLLSSKLCRDEQKEDKAPEKNDDKDNLCNR